MSYKLLGIFLLAFGCSYIGALFALKNSAESPQVVLAQDSPDSKEIVSSEPVNQPEAEVSVIESTPSPKPTKTPTPKPSPTNTPTPKPTIVPTPEPTPTPDPTPTPVPTPTPDVWSPPDMEPTFARYAGQYGIDKNILERLANCESHFNINSINGDYVGMFQFGSNTWISTRQQMGEDSNLALRSDIDASIKTAAYLISVRGASPWPSCLR